MTDDIIENNILPFKRKESIPLPPEDDGYIFTDGIEEYNVDEYVDILVEDLVDIQFEMQAILEHPEGLSNVSRLAGLVAELTNVIDGYSEETI